VKLPPYVKGCRGVVLDTMVFIYFFEDHPIFGPISEFLFDQAARGVFSASLTPVTAAELLVKPLRAGRTEIADRYRRALGSLPNLTVVNLTWEMGCMAGALRARYNLPLPDLLQVAAALRENRPTLVTNDKALKVIKEVRVVLLDDLR